MVGLYCNEEPLSVCYIPALARPRLFTKRKHSVMLCRAASAASGPYRASVEIRLGNSIYVYAFHKEKAARLVLLISDHQDMAW